MLTKEKNLKLLSLLAKIPHNIIIQAELLTKIPTKP